jgi:hypothetical protein
MAPAIADRRPKYVTKSRVIQRHAEVSGRCPLLHRLCCKSRNLQGHEFFAKTQNGKQSPIRVGGNRVVEVACEFSVRR